jgi:hypothetical protein
MTDSAVAHLERLVGFNTISHLSNAGLIHYAADHLRAFGVEPVLSPRSHRHEARLARDLGANAGRRRDPFRSQRCRAG